MPPTLLLRVHDRRLVRRAVDAGFTQFLFDGPVPRVGRIDAFTIRGDRLLKNGRPVGHYARIESGEDERRLRALNGDRGILLVEPTDWKVIPLENLIAGLSGRRALYAVAHDAAQARIFLQTLERGVDAVVLPLKAARDLEAYRDLITPPRPRLSLEAARVTRVEALGPGDRVCVDAVNLLRPAEGLLVGSTSRGFLLVAAETQANDYVEPRPFRVNAGAVHSYVWNGERTHYLSEVKAGMVLEAVDARGGRRPITVGRAKIETRPLVAVEARSGRARAAVVLQNAETVRLSQPRGRTRSVADVARGDTVLLHAEQAARHYGLKVRERLTER